MKKIRMIKSIYDNPQAESHLRLANDKAQSEAGAVLGIIPQPVSSKKHTFVAES